MLGIWPRVLHGILMPELPLPTGPLRASPLFSNTGQAPWLLAEVKVLGFNPPFDEELTVLQAFILLPLFSDLLSGSSTGTWHVLIRAPWGKAQGPVQLPEPTLLLPLPTTNLFWEPSPALLRRPSFSPPALPEAMPMTFLSDPELEAESASIHSDADSGSPSVADSHASFTGTSLTAAGLQLVLGSLAGDDDAGPRCEFSCWGPEVL